MSETLQPITGETRVESPYSFADQVEWPLHKLQSIFSEMEKALTNGIISDEYMDDFLKMKSNAEFELRQR